MGLEVPFQGGTYRYLATSTAPGRDSKTVGWEWQWPSAVQKHGAPYRRQGTESLILSTRASCQGREGERCSGGGLPEHPHEYLEPPGYLGLEPPWRTG